MKNDRNDKSDYHYQQARIEDEALVRDRACFDSQMSEHSEEMAMKKDKDLFIKMRLSQLRLERAMLYTTDYRGYKLKGYSLQCRRDYIKSLIKEIRELRK